MTINISGLSKAKVLAALYNNSKPLGMGFLQFDPCEMSEEDAQSLLDGGHMYFDFLKGRVMKVDLKTDEVDPWGYDRGNGQGALEKIVNELRKESLQ